jgi:hypothetical protein
MMRHDSQEAAMTRYIRAVPHELLIKANSKAVAGREKYGSADVAVSIVTALAKNHDPEDLIAVSYRLQALARLLDDGDGEQWTLKIEGKEYKLLNEALFRAAAKTPLRERKMVRDVKFDSREFLRIALEEAESEGSG